MELRELLVVVPHSGILIPYEIPFDSLSEEFPRLARNVDWYTIWLYNFQGILDNSTLIFPYCSIVLEANRDPLDIDSCVPLMDSLGEHIYRPKREPSLQMRRLLAKKYLAQFHQKIKQELKNKSFLLDAHSTVTAKGVADNQIELMNYQISKKDGGRVQFCPDSFVYTYAEELTKRLPFVKVSVNESRYLDVYGHVCGKHSINAESRVGNRVPAILQETNQKLYMNSNATPNLEAIDTLRRSFAEALSEMIKKVGNSRKGSR